jgi:outer membrane protein assembly factor BamB
MRSIRAIGLLVLALLLLTVSRLPAKILLAIPLGSVLNESKLILAAKVESVDGEKLQMVLSVAETFKGKADFQKLPVVLKGDAEAQKEKQVPDLLKRVQVGTPLILFVNPRGEREFQAFGFTEGTWFAMTGVHPKDAELPRWSWNHFEPYLRRTYKGTTAELRDVVIDVLAGKKKAPEVDNKVPPGIGPEIEKKEQPKDKSQSSLRRTGGPLLGVIPSVVIAGPLAFLAMLFPAVFGGVLLGARRWMVALTVVSTNTTLYAVHAWFAPFSVTTLWLSMTLITALGAWWSWQRYTSALVQSVLATASRGTGTPAAGTISPVLASPGRAEFLTLAGLSGLALLGAWLFMPRAVLPGSIGQMRLEDKLLAAILVGVVAATIHVGYVSWRNRGAKVSPRLPGEGVLLLAMLVASIAFLPTLTVAEASEGTPGSVVSAPGAGEDKPTFKKIAWRFIPAEPSWIASSPVVAGNRVYVGAVHGTAFRSGTVYSVDATTGKVVASFNNGGSMKDIFCSPTVADGCVYIGEGFHQHLGCKLFCLDAETLEKKWEFATESHTESTPCVVDGRVYFGAGDHGLFCLDAKSGKEIWHLSGLHIDSNPLVVGGRVYVGSGKGDAYQTFAVACLDAVTGDEKWRTPLDLPCWGGAVLAGDLLLVGIGNGNFLESEEKPAGAVLALDAKTGQRIWRTSEKDITDGVHIRVATDGAHVWAASRDKRVICLSVAEGKKVWSRDLGNPIVASPALVPYLTLGDHFTTALGQQPGKFPAGGSLIVAASGNAQDGKGGQVVSLDPRTGQTQWSFDVAKDADTPDVALFSSPCVVASTEGGVERRRIFLGCGLNGCSKGILYCLEDERKP